VPTCRYSQGASAQKAAPSALTPPTALPPLEGAIRPNAPLVSSKRKVLTSRPQTPRNALAARVVVAKWRVAVQAVSAGRSTRSQVR
jgi:hypothetical protein